MSADRVRAYIALGANLGDSAATLKTVLDELRQTPGIAAVTASRFYRTAPVEATGPDFVNAAAALDTTLAPLELLDVLQALELRHGRERPTRTRRARWTWTCCSTATSPSKTSAWSCPIPACTCAPSCCVRCWTWPHPARRRPPGRRLAGRHPRPAHLPAVKAPRDNRLPIPTSKPGTTPGPTPASRIEAARCRLGRSVAAPC